MVRGAYTWLFSTDAASLEGVEVIVDVVLNHMARPCAEAQDKADGMPCVAWPAK